MDNNIRALEKNLNDTLDKTKHRIRENKKQSKEDYDSIAASLCLLERVAVADNVMVEALCDIRIEKDTMKASLWPYKETKGGRNAHTPSITKCTFTMTSSNTPDFQIWANVINSTINANRNSNKMLNLNPNPPSKKVSGTSGLLPPSDIDDIQYVELVKVSSS